MNACTLEQVRAAKPRAREIFAALTRVSGVGVTRVGDGYGLKINLEEPPASAVNLPQDVNGVPVRIAVVGNIRKHG